MGRAIGTPEPGRRRASPHPLFTAPPGAASVVVPGDDRALSADARARIGEAIAQSRAPATRRAYASAWAGWARYAAAVGAAALPATPAAVAAYLTARAQAGCSHSTLGVIRAAIRAVHRDAAAPDPTEHEGVRRTLAGLRRASRRPVRQAAPLTGEELAAIVATTPDTAIGRRDLALLRTMRDALLRRSEAAALTWADIETQPDGSARLHLRRSKTDQEGAGAVLYLAAETADALAAIRPPDAGAGTPIFVASRGGGALGGRAIGERVRLAARRAGLAGDYSGHSLRVGTAVELARLGATLPELMAAGRWASPQMPAHYTRGEAAGRGAVARLLYGTGARRRHPRPQRASAQEDAE